MIIITKGIKRSSRYLLLLGLVTGMGQSISARQPERLKLEDCYSLAEQNYPLVKQRDLLEKSKAYAVSNVSKGYLPQFSLDGQATFQSDVTKISVNIPGVDLSSLGSSITKDQYKIYGELDQPLTGMLTTARQKQLQAVKSDIQRENLEVDLYTLKDRINQLFFGVLLLDEQYRENELRKKDIQNGISDVTVAIRNGADFQSSADKLKAELLIANQQGITLKSSREAYAEMLGLFINRTINDSTVFEKPEAPPVSTTITRPELAVFNSRDKSDAVQRKLLTAKNIPHFDLFFQGGLGQPSPVNMLSGKLSPYYIGGIRLSWPLSGLYTFHHDAQLLDIDRSTTDVQRETFLFNTRLTLKQQNAEITKLQDLIRSDDEIVSLRVSVKKTASVQLANGAITVNDYLKEVNAEDEARQNRLLHEVQLLMALYDHQNTAGN